MKYIILLSLVLSLNAYAGSSGCSSASTPAFHSVTSGDYNAQSSDCVISVDKSVFEFTYIYLPESPSTGDEFLIVENTSAEPECTVFEGETYCWPAGVGAQAYNQSQTGITVDYSVTAVLGDFHEQVKLIYDGSGNWAAQYIYP